MTRSSLRTGPLNRVGCVLALVTFIVIVVFSVRRFNFSAPRDAKWLKETPIAHRGLHTSRFDENSLASFTNAVSHGYAMELDVRPTREKLPVVIHDNNLDRLLGIDESVSKMVLPDVKRLRLPLSGEEIPTLEEALERINGQVPVLVEIKSFGLPGEFEQKVLSSLRQYRGEFAVQSFNPLVCRWFRKHAPNLTIGLLLDDIPYLKFGLIRNLKDNLFSAICSPNFVAYNYATLNAGITQAYRNSGLILLGYGLNDQDVSDKSYLRYVDNAIFDLSEPKR